MNRFVVAALLLALSVVVGLSVARPPGRRPAARSFGGVSLVPNYDSVPPRDTVASPSRPEVGFRSEERLRDHFRRHGREFGAARASQYLAMAQALRDRPAEGTVLEAVRGDGVLVRFDRATGAFLACDGDGTIRTFFRPRTGEAYYRRQLARAAR